MSSANDVTNTTNASTGIQTSPVGATPVTATTAEAPTIPLPPPPVQQRIPWNANQLIAITKRLDVILVVLVLLGAGILALFPVRNSDFWLHMATARNWVQGKNGFYDEPFSYTATNAWVNHSWLYDLGLYAGYQTIGGTALVVLKALVVVALAWIMMQTRRRELGLWLPAVFTLLGMLALSPRLLFQPTVLSMLLLGLTFALLMRREVRRPLTDPEPPKGKSLLEPVSWLPDAERRYLWLLPVLFALWVNLDSWFFLGPLVLALMTLGAFVEEKLFGGKVVRPGEWKPMLVVLGVGLVACLLNPYGVNALRLPGELVSFGVIEKLKEDHDLGILFYSPWQSEYFQDPEHRIERITVTNLAFYPLFLLAFTAIVMNRGRLRVGAVLVSVALLLLASYHARAIPFFAVVVAPFAALNFQEYGARTFGIEPAQHGFWREWPVLGRGLSIVVTLGLVLLSWAGWVHGEQLKDSRHVGAYAEPDPAMIPLAKQLQEWRREGKLTKDDHIFNITPDVPNQLAWLCTEYPEPGFFDYRLALYTPERAEEYVRIRDEMLDRPRKEESEKKADWTQICHERGATLIVHQSPSVVDLDSTLSRLYREATKMTLLYLRSRVMVFAVYDHTLKPQRNVFIERLQAQGLKLNPMFPKPPETGHFAGMYYEPWQYAFGDKVEKLPDVKPTVVSEPVSLWHLYLFGPQRRSPDSDDAFTQGAYFDRSAEQWTYRHRMIQNASAQGVGLIGNIVGASLTGPCASGAIATRIVLQLPREPPPLPAFPRGRDGEVAFDGPIAPAILAIRSGRRAILANPSDDRANVYLGRAYERLGSRSEEQFWGSQRLSTLRMVQTVSAYRRATLLYHDALDAHWGLFQAYSRMGFADLAMKHYAEAVRCLKAIPVRPGDEQKNEDNLKRLDEDLQKMEEALKKHISEYEAKSLLQKPAKKAQTALEAGLAQKALDVLLAAQSKDDLDVDVARLEVELLARTGMMDELRVQIVPEKDKEKEEEVLRKLFDPGDYEWYRALLAAATGDYAEADDFIRQAGERVADEKVQEKIRTTLLGKSDASNQKLGLREISAVVVGLSLTKHIPEVGVPNLPLLRQPWELAEVRMQVDMATVPLRQQAEFEMLRGILALEAGDRDAARKYFRQSLYGDDPDRKTPAMSFPGVIGAVRSLEMMEGRE
jgi:tetratricopeptide (TPR) repeat protein